MKKNTNIFKQLRAANTHGITLRQLILLIKLEDGPMTPKDISTLVNISGAAVTVLLDKLQTLGFTVRVHDKKDRRQIFIHRTPKGRALCDSINKA